MKRKAQRVGQEKIFRDNKAERSSITERIRRKRQRMKDRFCKRMRKPQPLSGLPEQSLFS